MHPKVTRRYKAGLCAIFWTLMVRESVHDQSMPISAIAAMHLLLLPSIDGARNTPPAPFSLNSLSGWESVNSLDA